MLGLSFFDLPPSFELSLLGMYLQSEQMKGKDGDVLNLRLAPYPLFLGILVFPALRVPKTSLSRFTCQCMKHIDLDEMSLGSAFWHHVVKKGHCNSICSPPRLAVKTSQPGVCAAGSKGF